MDDGAFFVHKINKRTLEKLVQHLVDSNAKKQHVVVFIDSRGGCPAVALSMAHLISQYPHGCDTVVTNRAYSAAVLVAAAGRRRYALPGAKYMFHKTHFVYEGCAEDIESEMQADVTIDRKFNETLKTFTTLPDEILNTEVDMYLTASVVGAYNLVHSISMPWEHEAISADVVV